MKTNKFTLTQTSMAAKAIHILKSAMLPMLIVGLIIHSTPARANGDPESIATKLESYLTYPEVMRKSNSKGVVTIQFHLDRRQRITDLKVYAGNPDLQEEITRQLSGIKIQGAQVQPGTIHTVRLRFR